MTAAGLPRKFWSSEERQHLAVLYPPRSTAEVAKILGRTVEGVNGMAAKMKLHKTPEYIKAHCRLPKGSIAGRLHRYTKGHVPANKGVRRPGYAAGRMRDTQFKKGQQPHNTVPVGTILVDHDGYVRIKIRERRAGERGWHPRVWPPVHRLTWELRTGKRVPKGKLVVFKDGDRFNCVFENLELISRAEHARRNVMWNRYPRELALAIQMNGVLKRRIRSNQNGKEQNQRSA